MTRKALLQELAKMSSAERILLAQDLWDSVADDPDAIELSPAQQKELDRRMKAYQARKTAGKKSGSSWSAVKRRVRKG